MSGRVNRDASKHLDFAPSYEAWWGTNDDRKGNRLQNRPYVKKISQGRGGGTGLFLSEITHKSPVMWLTGNHFSPR